jgi:hypothetical protein
VVVAVVGIGIVGALSDGSPSTLAEPPVTPAAAADVTTAPASPSATTPADRPPAKTATASKKPKAKVTTATAEPTKQRAAKPKPKASKPATKKPRPEPKPACDPNYGGACVPIASDVDCEGGGGNGPEYVSGPVEIVGDDIYDLDRDGDGVGCE